MLTFPPAAGAPAVSAVKPAAEERRSRAARSGPGILRSRAPLAEGGRCRDRVVIRKLLCGFGMGRRESLSGLRPHRVSRSGVLHRHLLGSFVREPSREACRASRLAEPLCRKAFA